MSFPRHAVLLPLFVALFAAACEGNPVTPPPEPPLPSVSFSYSGDRMGVYRAEGDVPLDAERRPQYGTWAAGLQVSANVVGITAAQARTAPRADVFLLALNQVTTAGTYPISGDCETSTSACAIGFFAVEYDLVNRQPSSAEYFIVSGTVVITRMDANRIRGTFQGSGVRSPGSGTISFANGSFDVPIVRETVAVRSVGLNPAAILASLSPAPRAVTD